jgi:hypothetical protein
LTVADTAGLNNLRRPGKNAAGTTMREQLRFGSLAEKIEGRHHRPAIDQAAAFVARQRSDELVEQVFQKLLPAAGVRLDFAFLEDVRFKILEADLAFFDLLSNA